MSASTAVKSSASVRKIFILWFLILAHYLKYLELHLDQTKSVHEEILHRMLFKIFLENTNCLFYQKFCSNVLFVFKQSTGGTQRMFIWLSQTTMNYQ